MMPPLAGGRQSQGSRATGPRQALTGPVLKVLAIAVSAIGFDGTARAAVAPAMSWQAGMALGGGVVLLLSAAALAVLAFWIRKLERRRLAEELAWLQCALDEVDVFGSEPPQIDDGGRRSHSLLISRINALLDRVHQYKRKLMERDRRLRRVLSNVNDVLFQTNAAGEVVWITDSVEHILGYRPEEIRGRRFQELLVRQDRYTLHEAGSEMGHYSVRAYRRDGSIAWLLLTVRHLTDANGHAIGSEAVCRDGTDLIAAEEALFRERKRAQITLASIGDGVITTDTSGRVDYLNPAAESMTGVERTSAARCTLDEVCQLLDLSSEEPITGLALSCMESGEQVSLQRNVLLRHGAGAHDSVVEVSVAPIRDSRQEVSGAVVVLHDVTRLSEMTQRMYHQATHDTLTGLPNRQVFESRLESLLEQARTGDQHHALCYLDLDQFKLINDTCGHSAGDELLRQVANELRQPIGEQDTLARLGGDEFGILLIHSPLERSRAIAEALRARVEDFRFAWQNKLFRVSVSIGMVAINRDSGAAGDLLSSADGACYIAKEGGRNRIHVYCAKRQEVARWHNDMELIRHIRHALDNDSFELHGQIMRTLNWFPGDRVSMELLVRMRSVDGLMAPQDFLPIAERYQLMPEIDRWVVNRALEIIADGGTTLARVQYFSINLSGQSMSDDLFSDFVIERIRSSGVNPKRLVFEITETTAVTNLGRAAVLMERLRQMGCLFALDDFGSGLSSFSYLKQLPLDFLKIDGTFVRNICSDPVDLETVKSINQVGHAMGLITIAEYVGDREILETLRSIGVDYVQGFYLGKPRPLESLLKTPYFEPPSKLSRG